MPQPNKDRGFALGVSSFLRRRPRVPSKGLTIGPSLLTAAFLAVALLVAIAVARGQQVPFVTFIPNGVFFPNPNGA